MKPFTTPFGTYVHDGAEITATVDGFKLTATLHEDRDTYAPWKNEDGHGPVSDWTTREVKPWERVICADRYLRRLYNYSAAVRTAIREGWGVEGGRWADETPREYAKRAVEQDIKVLQAWARGEWHYFGVSVTVEKTGVELVHQYDHACWGIEGNYPGSDNSYLLETANALAEEALYAARAKAKELCAAFCDEGT